MINSLREEREQQQQQRKIPSHATLAVADVGGQSPCHPGCRQSITRGARYVALFACEKDLDEVRTEEPGQARTDQSQNGRKFVNVDCGGTVRDTRPTLAEDEMEKEISAGNADAPGIPRHLGVVDIPEVGVKL